jgi:serine/threonine protein phosphatase PrpC
VIVDDMCYFANLGDSRGVLSSETGKNINQINIEHTPTNEGEKNRIKEMGGKIYQ